MHDSLDRPAADCGRPHRSRQLPGACRSHHLIGGAGYAAYRQPVTREPVERLWTRHWHWRPALPSAILGKAWVIDGDTVDVSGTRVRLDGIDAPETGQTCADARGQAWLCGSIAARENVLRRDELITAVELPASGLAARSRYRKVRDRASYAFALVSVAAAMQVDDGRVVDVRLAVGGVSGKPWRAYRAEELLRGEAATEENFRRAAAAEFADAVGRAGNAYKIELGQRTMVAVLRDLRGEEGLI